MKDRGWLKTALLDAAKSRQGLSSPIGHNTVKCSECDKDIFWKVEAMLIIQGKYYHVSRGCVWGERVVELLEEIDAN